SDCALNEERAAVKLFDGDVDLGVFQITVFQPPGDNPADLFGRLAGDRSRPQKPERDYSGRIDSVIDRQLRRVFHDDLDHIPRGEFVILVIVFEDDYIRYVALASGSASGSSGTIGAAARIAFRRGNYSGSLLPRLSLPERGAR